MIVFLLSIAYRKTWLLVYILHLLELIGTRSIVSFFQAVANLASAGIVFQTGGRSRRMPLPTRQDTLTFCPPETDRWMQVPSWEMR